MDVMKSIPAAHTRFSIDQHGARLRTHARARTRTRLHHDAPERHGVAIAPDLQVEKDLGVGLRESAAGARVSRGARVWVWLALCFGSQRATAPAAAAAAARMNPPPSTPNTDAVAGVTGVRASRRASRQQRLFDSGGGQANTSHVARRCAAMHTPRRRPLRAPLQLCHAQCAWPGTRKTRSGAGTRSGRSCFPAAHRVWLAERRAKVDGRLGDFQDLFLGRRGRALTHCGGGGRGRGAWAMTAAWRVYVCRRDQHSLTRMRRPLPSAAPLPGAHARSQCALASFSTQCP